MAKKRKITNTDKAFYQLGYQDGERRERKMLLLLQKTNRALWDELCKLDERKPIVGVLMSFKVVERLIKSLKKPIKHLSLAREFNKMLKEAKRKQQLFQPK